ncbi:MAG: SIMPL domain-containing protein [Porticoccaceae bacterium]
MKALQFCSFVLFAASIATAAPVHADAVQPRTVSTSGQGVAKAKADKAQVTMQTSSLQKSATEAKQEVDRRINSFLGKVTGIGIAKEDIVASTLRISPEYEYDNRTRIFSGYTAYRDVSVTLHDLDKLDQLLQVATDSGISFIQNIQLQSQNEEKLRKQAFDNAIADSQEKAEALAKAYGAQLGAVHSIVYQNPQPLYAPKAEMAVMRMAADSGSGGQYLHDEVTFNDNVHVVFELIVPR